MPGHAEKFDELMNQEEAAQYITKVWKKYDGPKLSNVTNNGDGPDFVRKGNQKLFWKSDIDDWIDEQIEKAKTGDQ